MKEQSVIIIGGGICGLYAAKLLAAHCNVTILEANDRLGGRIWDMQESGFSAVVKRGAEFIHGNAELSFSLLKEAGIDYKEVDGKMYTLHAGAIKETDFFIEGWDELLQNMKGVNIDITLHEFLDYYFKEDKYAELRRQVMRYAEGYDIADPDKVSVMTLYNEWSADEVTYQLSAGYGALVEHLVQQCKMLGVTIHTDKIVKQINWKDNKVTIVTEDESEFDAKKAIVTVPLGVLQKRNERASIEFSPTLDMHIAAAQKIGFGSVVKAVLEFKQPFWDTEAAFIFGDQLFQTWWTQMPYESNMLTGWAGGGKAKELSNFTEEELEGVALSSVAEIFGKPLAELKKNLKAIKITNWQQYEFSDGAYSYPTPATKEARAVLNTPASDTIYFAGEALFNGSFSGTVEAALLTAKSTSEHIMLL
jgi:monoamine oxidase